MTGKPFQARRRAGGADQGDVHRAVAGRGDELVGVVLEQFELDRGVPRWNAAARRTAA